MEQVIRSYKCSTWMAKQNSYPSYKMEPPEHEHIQSASIGSQDVTYHRPSPIVNPKIFLPLTKKKKATKSVTGKHQYGPRMTFYTPAIKTAVTEGT